MQSCMFDQSAYISYLVEEAVNGLDNSNAPSTSTQSQQHIATPSTHTPPYQADFSFPRNTGAPNFPPLGSVSFNPQLTQPPQRLQLYVAPVQQNIPQNPVPVPNPAYPVSFGAVTNYLPQQESQSTISSLRYQASSFCLNQHIGSDEPTIVNASQINNKIHVQFQFGDNDRFSVQSTNTTESNGPGVNWQNFGSNVSESTAGTVNLNIPTVVQPGNVQTNNNCHSNTPTDIGDFSQFRVSNILRKNCTDVGNTTDANKTALNTENVKHDRQVEEREYFRLFMKKEKEIEKNRIWHGSEWNYNKSEVNHKLTEKVGSLKKGANKVKTVTDTQSTLQVNKQGYYEFSHLYSKSYLQHGKKHKTKKDNSKKSDTGKKLKRSVPVKKSRSKVGEVCEKVTLLKLTYQCGDCTQTYDNIEDLKKHIRENHKETNKSCEGSSKSQESENKVIDLTETEETDEVSMARETEEQDIMEVESENTSSDPQSYLCSYCGYDCKSKDESEEHQKIHKYEVDGENREIDCHKEGREYFQMSQKLVECQKERENEKRKNMEERNHKEEEAFAKAKAIEEVPLQKTQSFSQGSKTKKSNDKNKNVSNLRLERLQQPEENRILPKRRAATQAKNTLMNPSKGKQKRIRDTKNLNKEDTMLMEMFGIIPSKVCLSRVQESENLESQIVNSSSDDLGQEKRIEIERNLEGGEKQVTENNTVENNHSDVVINISNSQNDTPIVNNFGDDLVHEKSGTNGKKEENMEGKEIQIAGNNEVAKNHWSKIINMSNSENEVNAKENMFDDKAFSDDDSDIEIVEPPMTLIVLDDEAEEAATKKESPKKSDKEIMKSFGLKDVTVNIEKTEKSKVKESPGKEKSRSDTELMEKFGIKDLSVSLTSTPTKVKRKRPGPKSKTQTGSRQTRGSKSTGNAAVKNIEEMSPNEIEKLLYECGMGISVPVQSQNTSDNGKGSNDKAKRTPSPVPSTSKGHGQLRRKRTARKSTKDSALFKEYKLKDSKVIIRNLSRIDISLLRNPNSPFGKSDWLKHKFDSDTESDFEFDIPTPPLLEDFVENTGPSGGERIGQNVLSSRTGPPVKTGRKSPVKQKDLKAMKKFGISDSVVVIDSQKKNENSKLDIGKKKTLSDEELRKKFGIPNTMVVINTSEKTADSCKKEPSDKKEAEKTSSYISFDDFKAALDSARKNVLNRLKTDEDYTKKEMEAEKDSSSKTMPSIGKLLYKNASL
ncbi:uncharacterized protein LOC128546759 [Mercenaria mercenaria]|uniref:uncharacterized protein LOC128546759 n=1 Tax=Mercenaria mercenaria TaxID=6596 RepID=UPI00234EC4A6|nr:uncharacterized protein LOC128546759 [Mercenaria mercenaria]